MCDIMSRISFFFFFYESFKNPLFSYFILEDRTNVDVVLYRTFVLPIVIDDVKISEIVFLYKK